MRDISHLSYQQLRDYRAAQATAEQAARLQLPRQVRKPAGRRGIRVDGVIDIETEDWATFVCGELLMSSGARARYEWPDEEKFVDAILDLRHGAVNERSRGKRRKCMIWAHNGGRFDGLWLLDHIVRRGLRARILNSGSTVLLIRIGKLTICDSYALSKISLKEFTAANRVKKIETGLGCKCGKECGGYCRIKRTMQRREMDALLSYLHFDCQSLLEALANLEEWAAKEDIDLGPTIAGSSWRNASRLCGLEPAVLDPDDFVFARSAYYGGRVQIFRPRSAAGWEYDVASMYPSQLATASMPVGVSRHVYDASARDAYRDLCPGVYRAYVTVPYSHLPPLPYRTKSRVWYPYGRFLGTWTLPELRYAESLGVTVQPREALIWYEQQILFADWIERLFSLRRSAPGGKSGPIGTFLKFYMNSITGKFGSSPEKLEIETHPDVIRVCKCASKCDGWCGAHQPLNDACTVLAVKAWKIDKCAHAEWAAYLTSTARIGWHRQAIALGNDGLDVVYGDTDSLFVERERTDNIGFGLGQWEPKGPYSDFRGTAPKVYTFERNDILIAKAKGLSIDNLSPIDAQVAIENGLPIHRRGVSGWKSSLRRDGVMFGVTSSHRHANVGYGDRCLNRARGVTEPRDADDIDG